MFVGRGGDREQQLKRTQAASMHAAAAEAGAIGEQQLEADANGEQRMQSGPGAALATRSAVAPRNVICII